MPQMIPTSRRVRLATGLWYHLLEWGAEDRSRDHTVVLIHGFLDLGAGWIETVEAGLGERYHVVAPDMRGHGDSDPVGAGGYYYFADYLADLHELVTQVGRGSVSLVGHSMGGGVASYYTGSYPERIRSLALLEGIGPPPQQEAGPARVQTWLSSWQRVRERPPRSYASIEEAAARLREHDPLLSHELSLALAERGTRRDEKGGLRFKHDPLHATPGPYGFDRAAAERFWRAVKCPVLLVDASQSAFRLAPDDLAWRRACFANVREVTLEGAGHMMQRHRPAELARVLADFLDRA